MTSRNKYRIAAMLALVVGLLTIVEGGSVLLGLETKPYPVLPWLLWYNVAFGFLSLLAGAGLWTEKGIAAMLARVILFCHATVLLLLLIISLVGATVAAVSMMAMFFRTAIWTAINLLLRGREDPAGPAA